MIGVTDVGKQRNAKSSYSTANSIAYYTLNGNIYPGAQNLGGTALKVGDTV
jgi:hypothetical protein